MSTNLSPEAKLAEQEYNEATTLDDKIVKLEKFISLVPKHKATEKLVARLRSRLVKYKSEVEEKRRRQRSLSKGPSWVVPKDGDAQVSFVGIANTGKTQLLKVLSGANVKPTDYPYSTDKPDPGVLDCEGAIIQLIDLPSIYPNYKNESKNGPMLFSQIRAADLIIFVIDLSEAPLEQMKLLMDELYSGDIRVNKEKPPIELKKTGSGGSIIIGLDKIDASREEINEILHEQSMYNVSLKILKQMTLGDLVEALDDSIIYLKGIIVANKGDLIGSKENYQKLHEKYSNRFKILPISALKGEHLEELKKLIFEQLDLVRIRSKEPNGPIAPKPIVMKKGATVGEIAKIIHSRFYENFRQAKIYGPSAKFDGQSVGLNHVLHDGDVLEIFAD
ncbi:MAG: 50S ribosome-binding GTPase [Candidatus Heimdallarchaeota archaeon]|nr:50S ribosome-binding GTPase [Candidatus Heimdallarchaeota archaeon]